MEDGRSLRSAAELNKRLSNWLLKNWWIIPALIVVFGALAWADPSPTSIPFNPIQPTIGRQQAGAPSSIPTISDCNACKDETKCDCKTAKCTSQCGKSIYCDKAALEICINSLKIPANISKQLNNPGEYLACLFGGNCNPGIEK